MSKDYLNFNCCHQLLERKWFSQSLNILKHPLFDPINLKSEPFPNELRERIDLPKLHFQNWLVLRQKDHFRYQDEQNLAKIGQLLPYQIIISLITEPFS